MPLPHNLYDYCSIRISSLVEKYLVVKRKISFVDKADILLTKLIIRGGYMNEYLIKLKNFTLDFWQDNDVRIYLFGSWARGEARQSSDVDIAIESKSGVKIDSALEYKVNEFREALENSDIIYIVDVVYMGMAAESLRRSIHQEGILWKS